jgi:adenylate kinase family enzyme
VLWRPDDTLLSESALRSAGISVWWKLNWFDVPRNKRQTWYMRKKMNKRCGRSGAEGNGSPSPFDNLQRVVADDPYWAERLGPIFDGEAHSFSLHLAVFVEPYLGYLLGGRKTVESRFSAVRCPPYRRVQPGDAVLLKASGGPIVGLCQVRQTWFYRLDPDSWRFIRKEFTEALCAQDPEFWRSREHASFATLLLVENVRRVSPVPWAKRDRRGWVVIKPGHEATLFEDLMENIVLAFSGGIASGKSEASSAVAQALGCPRVSFGNYVRTITRLRGLEDSREYWQAVGESLIKEDLRQFCAAVLAQAPWEPGRPLVIDGVRHAEVAEALKTMVSPSGLRLVYIETEDASREKRLRHRSPEEKSLAELDRHSTEVQVKNTLRDLADLVVDGTKPGEELVREITEWTRRL